MTPAGACQPSAPADSEAALAPAPALSCALPVPDLPGGPWRLCPWRLCRVYRPRCWQEGWGGLPAGVAGCNWGKHLGPGQRVRAGAERGQTGPPNSSSVRGAQEGHRGGRRSRRTGRQVLQDSPARRRGPPSAWWEQPSRQVRGVAPDCWAARGAQSPSAARGMPGGVADRSPAAGTGREQGCGDSRQSNVFPRCLREEGGPGASQPGWEGVQGGERSSGTW